MFVVCNKCKWLSIDEHEQNVIREQGGGIYPHICRLYKKRVTHYPYAEPYIHPCEECIKSGAYCSYGERRGTQ